MPLQIDIPLSEGAPLPFFDMQASLEGVTYTLQFRWNVRNSAWYLDVLDEAGESILVAGVKVVADWPLSAYTVDRQPPGVFIAADTTGTGTDPALTDFGVRVVLLYYTSTELGL
jgi:hypothetical protein